MKYVSALAVVLTLTSTGCGSSPDPATKACLDFADTFADRASECGFSYSANRNAILDGLGGCGHFTSVRDEAQFRGACFSWIRGLTCTQIDTANLPVDASCRNQLQRLYVEKSLSDQSDSGVPAEVPECIAPVIDDVVN